MYVDSSLGLANRTVATQDTHKKASHVHSESENETVLHNTFATGCIHTVCTMPTETVYLPDDQYHHLNERVAQSDVDNLSQAIQQIVSEDMESTA